MSRRAWRITLLVFGLPVLAMGVSMVVGFFLPETHDVASRARFDVPPDTIWADVSDPERAASWRPDVKSVELLIDRDGPLAWRETGPTGSLTYERVAFDPPRRLVIRVDEPDLPFSGEWDYEIAPAGSSAVLTIRERGEVHNPVFRFMARFVFGYHSTLDGYLVALGRKYGEEVTPRHIPVEKDQIRNRRPGKPAG